MKKLFLLGCLLLLVCMPIAVSAADAGIVRCGTQTNTSGVITNPCTITDFFQMLLRIYNFMVYVIALPLATLLIVFGGVLILLSGMNANWFSTGKSIIWGTFIALAFVFGSWLIINTVFLAIGYRPVTGNWWSF